MLTNLFSHLLVLGLAGEIPTNTPAFQGYTLRLMLEQAQSAAVKWHLDRELIVTNRITYFKATAFPEGPTAEVVFGERYCFRTRRGGCLQFADLAYTPGWATISPQAAGATRNVDERAWLLTRWMGAANRLTLRQAQQSAVAALQAYGVPMKELGFKKPTESRQIRWVIGANHYSLPYYGFAWRSQRGVCRVGISGILKNIAYFQFEGPGLGLPKPTNYLELLGLSRDVELVNSDRLAYKYVSVGVMLAEANYWAERLGLIGAFPLKESDLRSQFVALPNVMVGGGLWTDQYFFGFNDRLSAVARLNPYGKGSMAECNRLLAQAISRINFADAYRLATNWLVALVVDVRELEKTNAHEVRQRMALIGGQEKLLPIFYVRWGPWDNAKVEVEIDGRTSSFVALRFNDAALCQRYGQPIQEIEKLLAIPDEEFQQYTEAERKALILRFTAPSSGPTNVTETLQKPGNLKPASYPFDK